jgi:peroxin-10
MSDHVSPAEAQSPSYSYPFASAPDIIRSHQKDSYFQGVLLNHLSDLLRNLYGSRFLHNYTNEARTFSELLYLGLTTLIGNRTLGEEYCDIIQIEDDTFKLPSIFRRASYILTSILLPYSLTKILPSFRSRIRTKLEANLRKLTRKQQQKSLSYRFQSYILTHLSTITSPSPIHAITLTVFYFSGAYYELSKRLVGLRYIFTKRIAPSEQRVGYEVLGVLLMLQMSVQTYLHLNTTFSSAAASTAAGSSAVLDNGVEIPLDAPSSTELLYPSTTANAHSMTSISKNTHTPLAKGARFDLSDEKTMSWIKGEQNRKCTLCLEELKDPSVLGCGHVFCWSCIGEWVREKPECPLCRRDILLQHILPLRG